MTKEKIKHCSFCDKRFVGKELISLAEHKKECRTIHEEKIDINEYDWEQAYH